MTADKTTEYPYAIVERHPSGNGWRWLVVENETDEARDYLDGWHAAGRGFRRLGRTETRWGARREARRALNTERRARAAKEDPDREVIR